MNLKFLHFDFDAFFATVEEIDHPYLKGKPMAVGGSSKRGILTTANYEARKYGLHSAMPIFQAKKLCPQVIIVPTRKDRYHEVSQNIFKILRKFSPRIEQMSIDEGCMDISHHQENPIILAKKIQKEVLAQSGCSLSIGISYTKSLAKIASDWNKPNGIFVIREEDMPGILEDLSITKISGVGPKTAERLNQLGVFKVRDLLALPKDLLVNNFGKTGEGIYLKIRGLDREEIQLHRERKSLGIERTFLHDIEDYPSLVKVSDRFVKELHGEMLRKKLLAKTFHIKIKTNDFKQITKSHSLEVPSRSLADIHRLTRYLLGQVYIDKPVRLFGLSASNLHKDSHQQIDLFDDYFTKR